MGLGWKVASDWVGRLASVLILGECRLRFSYTWEVAIVSLVLDWFYAWVLGGGPVEAAILDAQLHACQNVEVFEFGELGLCVGDMIVGPLHM